MHRSSPARASTPTSRATSTTPARSAPSPTRPTRRRCARTGTARSRPSATSTAARRPTRRHPMKYPILTTDELVAHIRRVALDRYETGGWDSIVEAWDDDQIREEIAGAKTTIGAERKMAFVVELYRSVDR